MRRTAAGFPELPDASWRDQPDAVIESGSRIAELEGWVDLERDRGTRPQVESYEVGAGESVVGHGGEQEPAGGVGRQVAPAFARPTGAA
jgi:hypothetical protein